MLKHGQTVVKCPEAFPLCAITAAVNPAWISRPLCKQPCYHNKYGCLCTWGERSTGWSGGVGAGITPIQSVTSLICGADLMSCLWVKVKATEGWLTSCGVGFRFQCASSDQKNIELLQKRYAQLRSLKWDSDWDSVLTVNYLKQFAA